MDGTPHCAECGVKMYEAGTLRKDAPIGSRKRGSAVYCVNCHLAFQRQVDPNHQFTSVENRVWRHVRKTDSCWLWDGVKQADGYGRAAWPPLRRRAAHRVVYELIVGPIPEDMEIDHLCRNILCVNPDHLEPVTGAENIRRAVEARRAVRSELCPNGHLYAETRNPRLSYVNCRACRNAKERAHRAALKASKESST